MVEWSKTLERRGLNSIIALRLRAKIRRKRNEPSRLSKTACPRLRPSGPESSNWKRLTSDLIAASAVDSDDSNPAAHFSRPGHTAQLIIYFLLAFKEGPELSSLCSPQPKSFSKGHLWMSFLTVPNVIRNLPWT